MNTNNHAPFHFWQKKVWWNIRKFQNIMTTAVFYEP